MATWDDVRAAVRRLPESTEDDASGGWKFGIRGKALAWERALRRSDLEALGEAAPSGTILALHVVDLESKDALIVARPDVFFTTPHFDGYRAVLARLEPLPVELLEDLLVEAWLDRAPKRLAKAWRMTNRP